MCPENSSNRYNRYYVLIKKIWKLVRWILTTTDNDSAVSFENTAWLLTMDSRFKIFLYIHTVYIKMKTFPGSLTFELFFRKSCTSRAKNRWSNADIQRHHVYFKMVLKGVNLELRFRMSQFRKSVSSDSVIAISLIFPDSCTVRKKNVQRLYL